MELGAAHRKGRKERKAQPQCGTWMAQIQRIFTNLVEFAQSLNEEEKRGITKNLTGDFFVLDADEKASFLL